MTTDGLVTGSVAQCDGTGYFARPDSPGDQALLVIPMITGIGRRVREFAHDFAGAGFTTLCWDPFDGASTDTHSVEELRALRDRFDDRRVLSRLGELLTMLQERWGARRIGVVGYCLGGRFALLLAADDGRVDATVGYHPTVPVTPATNHSIDPFTVAPQIRGPVLIHYPGQDDLVPYESLQRLEAALRSRLHASTLVHYHPDAGHGFSDTAKHHTEANRAAYRRAAPQTLAFLQTALHEAS